MRHKGAPTIHRYSMGSSHFHSTCSSTTLWSFKKNGRTSAFGRKTTLGISWLRGTYAASDVKRVAWDDQVDEDDSAIDRKSVIQRLQRHTLDKGDVDGVCDFPGANDPGTGDEFDENGAPQSTHRPSIIIGSIDDIDVPNGDYDEAVEEENEIGHRIEELVESGDIKEVLACFDFVQEMKKIKKDQSEVRESGRKLLMLMKDVGHQ
eukprot:scaffold3192_cov83-Skeletonema_marinoi.AAC.4